MFGKVKTSKYAWHVLKKVFACKIKAKLICLKEKLSRFSKGSKHDAKHLIAIKSLVDELLNIDYVELDVDFVIYNIAIIDGNFSLKGCNTEIIGH